MRLTLTAFLTLDGVMQAPGAPDEDSRGGFDHGGWQFPYAHDEDFSLVAEWFKRADAFLLGRVTYEIFANYWPTVTDENDPIASRLNALPKYVASKTLDSVDWSNSTLLIGDVAEAVATLKAQPGNELQVHGSGLLAQTLMARDLIDEYRFLTYPVVLGSGQRLFGRTTAAMRLVSVKHHDGSDAVITVYEPGGKPKYGSFAD